MNQNETCLEMRPHWTFRDELGIIEGVALKGKMIQIPEKLQQQATEQLHMDHMISEKTTPLARKSV